MFSTRLFPKLAITSFVLLAVAIALVPRQAWALGAQCTAPYVNVQGAGSAPTADPTGELTIQRVNIGEPFDGNCSHKSITFVLKVTTLDPGATGMVTPQYNTLWEVQFSVPDNSPTPINRTLFVTWDTETVPTGTFSYGFVDTSTGQNLHSSFICVPPATTCPVTGTAAPDGTISITLDTSAILGPFTPTTGSAFNVDLRNPGANLSSIQGNTYVCGCAGGSGIIFTESSTIGNGIYTSKGNVSCSAPPVAALSANPTTGNAPLMVNFDASGSNIPAGGCGTINSYIFDFGDMTGVTQTTPTASHTYTAAGIYPARVRVTSSVGLTSANVAEQDITVRNVIGSPQLLSIVSRLTHGGAGDQDIVLRQPPATPRGVECRSSASLGAGNYKMVFNFVNTLISVASASVTAPSGSPMVSSSMIGPNPNEYTVNLTGVPDQQYCTVTLHTAVDSLGASGDEIGTMGVLVGDVNASGLVTSGDTNLCKGQALQPVTASNFRDDINASGAITTGDANIIKQNALHSLPSPP